MIEIVAARIRDALQVYASAVEVEEGNPDHGFTILPIGEDLDEGELEIHAQDLLAPKRDEAIYLLTLSKIE